MFKTMIKTLNKPGHKMPAEIEIDKIPSYIFCRWLSGNPYTIQAANQINLYDKIPIYNQFHLVNKAFGGRIKYIPYPKNIKNSGDQEIDILVKHFNINEDTARDYLEFISPEELNYLLKIYEG